MRLYPQFLVLQHGHREAGGQPVHRRGGQGAGRLGGLRPHLGHRPRHPHGGSAGGQGGAELSVRRGAAHPQPGAGGARQLPRRVRREAGPLGGPAGRGLPDPVLLRRRHGGRRHTGRHAGGAGGNRHPVRQGGAAAAAGPGLRRLQPVRLRRRPEDHQPPAGGGVPVRLDKRERPGAAGTGGEACEQKDRLPGSRPRAGLRQRRPGRELSGAGIYLGYVPAHRPPAGTAGGARALHPDGGQRPLPHRAGRGEQPGGGGLLRLPPLQRRGKRRVV